MFHSILIPLTKRKQYMNINPFFFYRHAAPLATKPGKALDSKTTLLAYGAFRAARKIAFPPVMSVFHCW